MDKSQKRNIYRISFLIPNEYNWVNISSISVKTLNEFAKYLYSLNRDIEVLPYIPGGLHCGICAYPELDRTYLVNRIVKDIKDKLPIKKLFAKYFVYTWCEQIDLSKLPETIFIEDVYESLLSKGLTKKEAIQQTMYICDTESNSKKILRNSRWQFIYMFRKEFIRYMKQKGFDVVVDGGWVLNDKEREVKLGLIDKDGHLI